MFEGEDDLEGETSARESYVCGTDKPPSVDYKYRKGVSRCR